MRWGRVYVAGEHEGPYDDDGTTTRGDVVNFRRYDRDGDLVWKLSANTEEPNVSASVAGADTDASGNVYFAWGTSRATTDPSVRVYRGFLSKYSPTGTLLFRKELPNEVLRGLGTDASGNVYVTVTNYSGSINAFRVRKYSGSGRLVWNQELREQDFPDGLTGVSGLDIAPDGSVFIAAGYAPNSALLVKLRGGNGKFLNSSFVGGDVARDVKVGGGSVYVYSVLDSPFNFAPYVSKFRFDGSRVWQREGFFSSNDNFSNLRYAAATGGISADPRATST